MKRAPLSGGRCVNIRLITDRAKYQVHERRRAQGKTVLLLYKSCLIFASLAERKHFQERQQSLNTLPQQQNTTSQRQPLPQERPVIPVSENCSLTQSANNRIRGASWRFSGQAI